MLIQNTCYKYIHDCILYAFDIYNVIPANIYSCNTYINVLKHEKLPL